LVAELGPEAVSGLRSALDDALPSARLRPSPAAAVAVLVDALSPEAVSWLRLALAQVPSGTSR
jgi:hypothetical protein